MRHALLTLAALAAMACATSGTSMRIGADSFPPTDPDQVTISTHAPAGAVQIGEVVGYGKAGAMSFLLISAEWNARVLAAEIGGDLIVPVAEGEVGIETDFIFRRHRRTLKATVYRLPD